MSNRGKDTTEAQPDVVPFRRRDSTPGTEEGVAIYLAGHGTLSRPRLIELQYQRILRYLDALREKHEKRYSISEVFLDLCLPRLSAALRLEDVPSFVKLLEGVQAKRCKIVYFDIDENRSFTPRYHTQFVRQLLEGAGAKVLNAFYDEEKAVEWALKSRFGERAMADEITDSSDIVCFFPALAGDIASTALRRELGSTNEGVLSTRINYRLQDLQKQNAYAGGRRPFVEDGLVYEWMRPV